MKKFILPLLALGVSISSSAMATESFNFSNFSTQPTLVFPYSNNPAAQVIPDGIFVPPGGIKTIKTNFKDYTVYVCWTSWSRIFSQTHTSADCLESPFILVSCQNLAPDKVIASGNAYGIFSSNAPTLSCIDTTLNESNR